MRKYLATLVGGLLLAAPAAHAQLESCIKGEEALRGSEFSAAAEHFTICLDKAVLDNNMRAQALSLRAAAFAELGQWQRALEDQQGNIALQAPQDAWPMIMLGAYHRELKQYEPALAALRKAMSLDEDGPGTGPGMAVHYHMGQTLHAMGRYREAVEIYTLGIPKQPDYGYALYRRALSYEALGDRKMAKRDLFRVRELEPREGYEADVAATLKEYGFQVRKLRPDATR